MTASAPPGFHPLEDLEIDALVQSYIHQMALFEEAALLIEQRLRSELRANAVRALLSSRAKHPEDLRAKLQRKRADPRYAASALHERMDFVVTDLAGCRALVYQEPDV